VAKVVIIGGSGHVGTYLVPRLVEAGHQVVNVTRGQSKPYRPHAAWKEVETVIIDRAKEERAGIFGSSIGLLGGDIVIDMICFTLDSAEHLVAGLRGRVQHLLHCGTIWVCGPLTTVPASEDAPRNAFGEYGTQKAAIEEYLLREAHLTGFPATVFRPGHIVGPGWTPLNPAGHFSNTAFETIARGEELAIPNFGMETVHHVHADDVAQMVMRAIGNWNGAVGEAFNTVSPGAVTLKGYAEAMYRWFGHEPKLRFVPWEEWKAAHDPKDAQATWEHIYRSPSHSIAKAERLLGYKPRYTSLEAVYESVDALVAAGAITVPARA
jgi:nucleoside-diphosphate-sugar epimerase